MCGIFGIYQSSSPLHESHFYQIRDLLKHRGPDDFGIYLNPQKNTALTHNRLSIIDTSNAGHQPLCNEDKTVWISYNGEIYNFPELKHDLVQKGHQFHSKTDSEVLVHLYEEYGTDLFKKLNGMFAVILFDEKKDWLILGRDHFGQKPLYYYTDISSINRTFLCSSEIKTLRSYLNKMELDYLILDFYLYMGFTPPGFSIYKNIYKVLPSQSLVIKQGKIIQKQFFYNPSKSEPYGLGEKEILENLDHLLSEAVKRCLISDVPLGAFLSGGIDSSLVVAKMAQQSASQIKTFSIGFEEKDYSELNHAKKIADLFQTEHYEFILKADIIKKIPDLVDAFDEPFADSSALPTYFLAKETRKKVTVALSGDGGDEIFGGYERYIGEKMARQFSLLPFALRKYVFHPVLKKMSGSVENKDIFRRLHWLNKTSMSEPDWRYLNSYFQFEPGSNISRQNTNLQSNPYLSGAVNDYNQKNQNILFNMINFDIQYYLPDDILTKVDRATMAHSLESRAPLLDLDLCQFAAKLPANYLVKGLETKYLLKKLAKDILPTSIIQRKKQGFRLPLGKWFRNYLKEEILDVANNSELAQKKILNRNTIKKIFNDHLAEKGNYSFQIYNIFFLELWYRKNFC